MTVRTSGSANCRLELNYGVQAGIDMIPFMMQKDYKPKVSRLIVAMFAAY